MLPTNLSAENTHAGQLKKERRYTRGRGAAGVKRTPFILALLVGHVTAKLAERTHRPSEKSVQKNVEFYRNRPAARSKMN